MKPLPQAVMDLIATLPEERPAKIILNTNGKGHWEVEVFARYVIDEAVDVSRCLSGQLPAGNSLLT